MDLFFEDEAEETLKELKTAFESEKFEIYPISAVTGKGIKELLYGVNNILKGLEKIPVIF